MSSKVNMALDDIIKSNKGGNRGGRFERRGGRGNRGGRGGRGRGRNNNRDFQRQAYGEKRRFSGSEKGSTRLQVSNLPDNISNKDLRV
jgi:hypothetical protein